MAKVLVVYHLREPRPRVTLLDHLYSVRRYSGHTCYYLNVANRVPEYMERVDYDLVIFHYAFVSDRILPEHFARLVDRVAFLKDRDVPKAVIAQDEYIHGDLLCRFINDFGVGTVFTCAEEPDWPRIYRDVDREKVRFHTVLTGYLDADTLARVERLRSANPKSIDIGYRSWYPWPSLGRHAQLKGLIGEVFADKSAEHGLHVDISSGRSDGNDTKDTLRGDDWYRFMLRCKYTIGVEGGATVLDYDGSIGERVLEYLKEHPQARYDEVEAACFPGQDGTLGLLALSPRHLEACATRTCQVLVEGHYNGVLTPGVHYIELKRDLSNVDEVLELVRGDSLREGIVDRAYRDVVQSGRWTYPAFVADMLAACPPATSVLTPADRVAARRANARDTLWRVLRLAKGRTRAAAVGVLGEERVLGTMRFVKRLASRSS